MSSSKHWPRSFSSSIDCSEPLSTIPTTHCDSLLSSTSYFIKQPPKPTAIAPPTARTTLRLRSLLSTMSTTTTHLTTPPTPWKSDFLSHLTHMPSPEFVLATLHPSSKSPTPVPTTTPTPPSSTPYLPRLRYCIYRGMWGELPENKHNTAPKNARVYESEMPTFTTDVRMEKVPELFASSAGKAEKEEQVQGSGGGGPCEAAFWIKETGTQWRMKGTAWVVGQDIEGEGTSGVRTVKSEVGRRMRIVDEEKAGKGEWSWEKELTAHFGNCSPGMRGQPPPLFPSE